MIRLVTLLLALFSSQIIIAQDKTEPEKVVKPEIKTIYYIYIPYTDGRFPLQGEIPCELGKNQTLSIPKIGKIKITPKTSNKDIIKFVASKLPRRQRESLLVNIRVRKSQFNRSEMIQAQQIHISGATEKPIDLKVAKTGNTLKEVIDLSKPTQFAALNRVELLRNGKIYKYNAKLKEHQPLKIYPGDVLFVPTQHMFGK